MLLSSGKSLYMPQEVGHPVGFKASGVLVDGFTPLLVFDPGICFARVSFCRLGHPLPYPTFFGRAGTEYFREVFDLAAIGVRAGPEDGKR